MPGRAASPEAGWGAVKTFNKRGDEGETSLLYGVRVAKSDPRCEAYGTVDEASSALGLACCLASAPVAEVLRPIQGELVVVAGEMALPSPKRASSLKQRLTPEMVDRLEGLIERFEQEVNIAHRFIPPGGCLSSAALDLARAIARRAEREAVRLKEQGLLFNPQVLGYLNRLADLLFVLARYEERQSHQG